MSDPERKSAMARTLERLKSRKRNVQGTSPGSSSTPPASNTSLNTSASNTTINTPG